MALDRLLLALLLLLLLLMNQYLSGETKGDVSSRELEEVRDNSSSRIALSAWYPDKSIGPSSWEYFRVELPVSFSLLTVTFTKKRWSLEGKGPLICFRYGGLPLPNYPVGTLQLAITKAGALQKSSDAAGKCSYLTETLQLSVTNEEVVSGLLFIATFSDPSSSRTQGKMISRGAIYKFDLEVLVTICEENHIGRNCSQTVNAAPFSRLYSAPQVDLGDISNSSWSSLKDCVDYSAWSYFLLQVPDLAPALEIAVDSETPFRLFARHQALPRENDEVTINGSSASVDAPSSGSWYIGVKAGNLTGSRTCFTLRWRILSCNAGYGGSDCISPLILLERVVTPWSESPFDSKYVPYQTNVRSSSFTWSFKNNYTGELNATSSWVYFQLEVPRGAAGSVLSLEFRATKRSPLELYTRFGGFPAVSSWDSRAVTKDNRSLSLNLIYPVEGIWSVALMFSPQARPDLKFYFSLHGCNNSCSDSGNCELKYDASRLFLYSFCKCDLTHGGVDCSEKLLSLSEKTLQIVALVGSNAAAILPSYWALRQKAMSEWLVYTTSGISSAIYHSCDAGGWCAMSFDTLQFLDFWLSFLAVIFTFLYLAKVLGLPNTTLHIAAAIVTAIIAKNDRTSPKRALAVIAIGAFGLLFGVLLEIWRHNPFGGWRGAIQRRPLFYRLEHRIGEFTKKLKSRFIWAYVGIGVMIVGFAGLCWKMEKAKTYWIWHSLWHVSIYTGAFFLLFSVVQPLAGDQNNSRSDRDPAASMSGEGPAETETFMNNNNNGNGPQQQSPSSLCLDDGT